MAEEFNLDNYILTTNDGSGELEFGKSEEKEISPTVIPEDATEISSQQTDKFSVLENSLNNLLAVQQRQSTALSTVIQALMSQQQGQPQEVDQEALSDIFTDADRGKNFLNVLEKSIERIIDSRFGQLQPIVQQSSIKAELDQLAGSVLDLPLYAQGMHQILGINPNLSFQQAYSLAKQYGWKTEPKQEDKFKQQTQSQTNVADINQRRNLPPKLDSSNAQLKSKEVKSVREAMEAALEELGA